MGGTPIRILHTADWHLGHELAGWTREAEQKQVLDDILELAVQHKVDGLIIAGDVFDHQNPSSAMYKMLFGFFDRLSRRAPDLVSIVIAGNHDSAARLEAPDSLLRRANVVVVGALHQDSRGIDLAHHLVALGSKERPIGHVLAIPYLRPADLPVPEAGKEEVGPGANHDGLGEGSLVNGVRQLYGRAIGAARTRIGELPLVVTGHLHVKGADLSQSLSERRLIIGGEHAIPANCFATEEGRGADYVALGHLHRAQSLDVTGQEAGQGQDRRQGRVRYAGSPLPLSAVERGYDHGVSLVELDETGRVSVEHVPLPRPAPFLRLPETGRLPLEEVEAALTALALDPQLPQEQRPFVQIALQISGPQPGFRTRLDEICMKFPIREVAPDIAWPGQAKADENSDEAPEKRLSELSPQELFVRAYEERHGVAPEKRYMEGFLRLMEEVGE